MDLVAYAHSHRTPVAPVRASLSALRIASWLEPQQIALDVERRECRHTLEWAAEAIARTHGLDPAVAQTFSGHVSRRRVLEVGDAIEVGSAFADTARHVAPTGVAP